MAITNIWGYIKNHIKSDFSSGVYLLTFAFLATALFCNYYFDLESQFLETKKGFTKFGYYFIVYSTGYYLVLALYSLFKKHSAHWYDKTFWIKSIAVLWVLSLDSSRPCLQPLIDTTFHADLKYYAYKILANMSSLVVVMLPLFVIYYYHDRQHKHFYGLAAKRVDLKPYLVLLTCMIPLIIAASFSSGFQRQYTADMASTAPCQYNS